MKRIIIAAFLLVLALDCRAFDQSAIMKDGTNVQISYSWKTPDSENWLGYRSINVTIVGELAKAERRFVVRVQGNYANNRYYSAQTLGSLQQEMVVAAGSSGTSEYILLPPVLGDMRMQISENGVVLLDGFHVPGVEYWRLRHGGGGVMQPVLYDSNLKSGLETYLSTHVQKEYACTLPDDPLGYSPFWQVYLPARQVIVAGTTYQKLTAQARDALRRYCVSGGHLLITDLDAQYWPERKPTKMEERLRSWPEGQGVFTVLDTAGLDNTQPWPLGLITPPTGETLNLMFSKNISNNARQMRAQMPMSAMGRVSQTLVLPLMIVMSLLLGPALMIFLKRRKQLTHYLWLAPLGCLLFSVCMVVIAIGAEGTTPYWSSVTFTMLDQRQQEAYTIGRHSFYTALFERPLKFPVDAAVINECYSDQQTASDFHYGPEGQILGSGWLRSRIPLHIKSYRVCRARERILVSMGPEGRPEVTNGLGVAVQQLWLRTDEGWFTLEGLEPGAHQSMRADLVPHAFTEALLPVKVLETSGWHENRFNIFRDEPRRMCGVNQYLAILEGSSPFSGQPLELSRGEHKALVLGTFEVEK